MSEERTKGDRPWRPGAMDRQGYLSSSHSWLFSHCLWKRWVSPSGHLHIALLLHYEFLDFERFIFGLGLESGQSWTGPKKTENCNRSRVRLGPTLKRDRVQDRTGSDLQTGLGPRSDWACLLSRIGSSVKPWVNKILF